MHYFKKSTNIKFVPANNRSPKVVDLKKSGLLNSIMEMVAY